MPTKTKHTPEKWGYMGTEEFGFVVHRAGPSEYIVADNIKRQDVARLIAAAPKLLDAAKLAESTIFCHECCSKWLPRDKERLEELRQAIREAGG